MKHILSFYSRAVLVSIAVFVFSTAHGAEVSVGDYLTDNTIRAYPQICQVRSGDSDCRIQLAWQSINPGQICVFNNGIQLECVNQGETHINLAANQSSEVELRAGSSVLDSIIIAAVNEASGLQDKPFGAEIQNRKITYRLQESALSASTWDGRLLFGTVPVGSIGSGKLGITVRVFRPELLDGKSANQAMLSDPNLYSQVHIVDTDSLTPAEVTTTSSQSHIQSMSGHDNLGNNDLEVKVDFHLAVYPHGSIKDNPLRSDANGNRKANGAYQTYYIYGILPTKKVFRNMGGVTSTIESPHYVNGVNGAKLHFLTQIAMKVVVANPETPNASIYSTAILKKSTPLYDTNGQFLHGYEPSVTLDGKLIVYSSNFDPGNNIGNGATVGYSYIHNMFLTNGWSVPNNLARMYWDDGPGGSETLLGGVTFSRLFPLARQPIREYFGTEFGANDIIIGSYPWITPDGSDVVFSSITGFHGAQRHGVTVVGQRSKWLLRRIDGQMDPVRGNVQMFYNQFDTDSTQLNQDLTAGYENQVNPNTGSSFGKQGWQSVVTVMLGQFASSWNGLNGLSTKPFPQTAQREAFGFFMALGRYSEVAFPDRRQDLLVYYSMNEPYEYNRALVNEHIAGPNKVDAETFRREAIQYVTDELADYSGNAITATLNSSAKFPFEHHDAEGVWENTRVVIDRNEGRLGNSVVFSKSGAATATLPASLANRIRDNQAFTIAAWFKKSHAQPTSLFRINSLVWLTLNGHRLDGRLYADGETNSSNRFLQPNVVTDNEWYHVALSYRANRLTAYVDGVPVYSNTFEGQILDTGAATLTLKLGPDGMGAANLENWIDEFYFYDSALEEDEIRALAFQQPLSVNIQTNTEKVALGQALFHDPILSDNDLVACSSCHDPANDFVDGLALATGIDGLSGERNTPSLWNVGLLRRNHWDGAVPSLAAQAINPIVQPHEMGENDLDELLARIAASPYYWDFNSIFGSPPELIQPTLSHLSEVIAHYVASLTTTGAHPLNEALPNDAAERGRRIFNGVGNCTACHTGPELTDGLFHDTGWAEPIGTFERGRGPVLRSQDLQFAMKTPSLINVSKTAPYFHDGRFATLTEVVQFYVNGDDAVVSGRNVSPHMRRLPLNSAQIAELVAYLESLDR